MSGSLRVSHSSGVRYSIVLGDWGIPDGSVCACVKAFVLAAIVGLWPQGFVCPAVSNCAACTPGIATGQNGHMRLFVEAFTHIHIPTIKLFQSETGGK